MQKMMKFKVFFVLALVMSILSACGGQSAAPSQQGSESTPPKESVAPEKLEPVTITIQRAAGNAGEFENVLISELQKVYPHITIAFNETPINTLVTSGEVPDIAVISQVNMLQYRDLGLSTDMEPLAKKFKLDLTQLQQEWVDMFRLDVNGKKTLVSIPFHTGVFALYYNKDIFDRFGVPYPKDELTWDNVVGISKQVARNDGGVQYYGIGFADMPTTFMGTQMGLPLVDDKTDKPLFNTEPWKAPMRMSKELFDASGIQPNAFRRATNVFTKDKTLAMLVANNEIRKFDDMNWDMVTMPIFTGGKKVGRGPTGLGMAITSTSEHKDDAFRVISVMLSEKVQSAVAKDGRPSILKNDSLKQEFVKSSSRLEGKNVMAVFKHPPAPFAPITEFDSSVNGALTRVFDDYLTGAKDMNTALREAEEESNKLIGELKAGK